MSKLENVSFLFNNGFRVDEVEILNLLESQGVIGEISYYIPNSLGVKYITLKSDFSEITGKLYKDHNIIIHSIHDKFVMFQEVGVNNL